MFSPATWLLISVLVASNVGKADDGHIRWRFSSVKENKSEYKLVFTAVVDRGWHLYSQFLEEGGPMPTSFEFEGSNDFKLLGKVVENGESKQVYDSTFMMNVVWYEKEVEFTQRVKIRSGVKITGQIRYSVCSEERCVPGNTRFSIETGI